MPLARVPGVALPLCAGVSLCHEGILSILNQSKSARVTSIVRMRAQRKYPNQFLTFGLRRLPPLPENRFNLRLIRMRWNYTNPSLDDGCPAASWPSHRLYARVLRAAPPFGGYVALPRR